MPPTTFSRRDFLKLSAAGVLSGVSVPWFESLARAAAIRRPRGKACILLWMDGGPSQQHTFDPKPGGEFRSAPTYLGPQHFPLAVNDPSRGLENLRPTGSDLDARLEMLMDSERRFAREYPLPAVGAQQAAFSRAVRLMQSPRARAFNLDAEP